MLLSSWENGIPLNKLFTQGGSLFNPPKRKHVLKRAESHRCEVNTLGTFACSFSSFSGADPDRSWRGATWRGGTKNIMESECADGARKFLGRENFLVFQLNNGLVYMFPPGSAARIQNETLKKDCIWVRIRGAKAEFPPPLNPPLLVFYGFSKELILENCLQNLKTE